MTGPRTCALPEADRLAAEQAAAAEAARVAADQVAAAEAAADKAVAEQQTSASRPGLGRLTSGFGQRWGRLRAGIDLAAGTGSPVRAAAAGRVVSAGTENGYGNAVRIKHADGTGTLMPTTARCWSTPGSAWQLASRSRTRATAAGPPARTCTSKPAFVTSPSPLVVAAGTRCRRLTDAA